MNDQRRRAFLVAAILSPVAVPQAIAEYEMREVARRMAFLLRVGSDENEKGGEHTSPP